MSLRLEMLQVARLAPTLLGDAAENVGAFIRGQFDPSGGCLNRGQTPDLYYTVFALDALEALREPLPGLSVRAYLEAAPEIETLDLVHLGCLAHCWTAIDPNALDIHERRTRILARLAQFRSGDGGYHPTPDSAHGAAYGAFLACGVHGNLNAEVPESMELVRSLKLLEREDGAWANDKATPQASTNATAAAVGALRFLGMPIASSVADWVWRQRHPQGGFLAAPQAPMPDLLSTATAIHTLVSLEFPIDEPHREVLLDYIDSLWTNEGGFYGHWADDAVDCEYTFYGLLALGHLSLA